MTILFFLMAAIVTISAIGVVCFRNAIYSALCLILNMMTIAGLFALLDAHFLATVQIIVYAGAVMVLVLFVLMLLNLKTEPIKRYGLVWYLFAAASGVLFFLLVAPIIKDAFSGFADVPLGTTPIEGTTKAMGEILYTRYTYPFEAASLLIMAAVVGAVMLAKKVYRTVR